jgi:hypothetical protein
LQMIDRSETLGLRVPAPQMFVSDVSERPSALAYGAATDV